MSEVASLYPWANSTLLQQLQTDPVAVLRDRGLNAPADMPPNLLTEFLRMVHLLWVNGEIVPLDQFRIDPMDEGLLFGRGVWESTRTSLGSPWLWNLHLDRLLQSAEILGIPIEASRLPSAVQVKEFVSQITTQDVVLRLNVTAGRLNHPGVVWMSLSPMVPRPEFLRLRTARNPVSKNQPYLMLKTFQYATRLRVGQEASLDGFDTALLLDDENNLQEASHANLFVRVKTGWVTPPADGGLLPGIVRHVLLTSSPVPISERPINVKELADVQEAFATNSNLGIVPVTQIDGYALPVGDETRSLIRWLEPPVSPGTKYMLVNRVMPRR